MLHGGFCEPVTRHDQATTRYGSWITGLSSMAGSVIHVVLFEFKPDVTASERREFCEQMRQLKDRCLHPRTGMPYIKSSIGGLDHSIEGHQESISHAFVVEYASKADRDYYVREDPAHRAFVQSVLPKLARAQIIDFTPGVYV